MAKRMIALAGLFVALAAVVVARGDDPETVMVTLRPKAGAEADVKAVIAAHWETARRLNLVLPEPHMTLEMKDETRALYYVDVFTWRDRDIPDNAPEAILKIWDDMNRLTAPRTGRPGLEIREVKRIDR
jgi:hypothetical protein